MGSYLDYHCPRCHFEVVVGGPEEFFLTGAGERRAYGHPEPSSAEAAARGVDGFWMKLWCDGCGAVKRIITLEFMSPCEPLDAWCGRGVPRPGYPADGAACPDCGAVLTDELPGPRPLCPSCREARLDCGKIAG